ERPVHPLHFSLYLLRCPDPPDLRSFPTRRSSDLLLYNQEMLEKSRESSRGRLKHFMAVKEQATELSIHNDLYINQLKAEQEKTIDRKSTRLNSSHVKISYAVFCLKKKSNTKKRLE